MPLRSFKSIIWISQIQSAPSVAESRNYVPAANGKNQQIIHEFEREVLF